MRKDSFASRFATYGCLGSLLSLALLAAICQVADRHSGFDNHFMPEQQLVSSNISRQRRAEEVGHAADEGEDISCGNIFLHVKNQPSAESVSIQDDLVDSYNQRLCQYAQNCDGELLSQKLLPLILCHGIDMKDQQRHHLETIFIYAVLPPVLLLYLLLLFRLLATTADSYFSPALESFSFELGLPPRFAGATLLALGNGSPDLGSTVNAILLWNEASATHAGMEGGGTRVHQGWRMAFGSLTGGGMFVGTIVCGLLIQSCSGITCRWAFLRDVSMYALSVCFVWYTLESGSVTPKDAMLFLGVYLGYVVLVFCADMYHRKVTLPRLHEEGKKRRKSLRMSLGQLAEQIKEDGALLDESTPLMNNCHNNGTETYEQLKVGGSEENIPDTEMADQITTLSGERIPRHPRLSTSDRFAMMMSNYDPRSVKFQKFDLTSRTSSGDSGDSSDEWEAITTMIHVVHPGIPHPPSVTSNTSKGQSITPPALESLREEPEPPVSIEQRSWSLGLLKDAYDELVFRFRRFLSNCFQDEDTSALEKICLFVELPFVAVRTITIPVPCEEHYCRPILALSIALSPYWLIWYASSIDIPAATYGFISFVIGLLILRYAGDESIPHVAMIPMSLYGFFIAATWIDTIADALVSLLQFLGILSRIPATILGITVLAWGNSMGDLSANLAMARKGMPDMATTGCFAGPSFNLLVGTGVGFLYLQYQLHRQVISPLSLTPGIRIGFTFIIINCLMIVVCGLGFKGRLPHRYSFFLFALYLLFIAMSLETMFR